MFLRGVAFVLSASIAATASAVAQEHQHHAPSRSVVSDERNGSGTSWLPDATPMLAIEGPVLGGWRTMFHGVAFVQYFRDEKPRGAAQFGSANWIMGELRKTGAYGDLAFRGMISFEPITVRGCGYPDLLATGEVCDGHAIVDKQHPHDLIMEVTTMYVRPLTSTVALQLYGGPAGEPALGPPAFPHRMSAVMNPLAPISHHWLDATHISYGVFTAGVNGRSWKVESSVFNGREPDADRYGFDFAALDSYSARVSVVPAPRWALQLSAGHLEEAENHGAERVDVNRLTASAIHHKLLNDGGIVATTVAWGRNVERGEATHALVGESTVSLADRHVFFARAEIAQKTSDDLDLHRATDDVHTIAKLQFGYSHFLPALRGWRVGVGLGMSVGVLPEELAPVYGGRAPLGAAMFLTIRPMPMRMADVVDATVAGR